MHPSQQYLLEGDSSTILLHQKPPISKSVAAKPLLYMSLTMGSVMRSSWDNCSPRKLACDSKKCRMNERTALGSEVGRYGSKRNGWSRPIVGHCNQHVVYTRIHPDNLCDKWHTSCFKLLRTTPDQLVNLFGLNICTCPSICPLWFCWLLLKIVCAFLLGFAIFAFEARKKTCHNGRWLEKEYLKSRGQKLS
jgi:hypothetical protein